MTIAAARIIEEVVYVALVGGFCSLVMEILETKIHKGRNI